MTDTHTHLYDSKAFADGCQAALLRAKEAGVKRFILPNVNVESVAEMLSLYDANKDCCHIAAGLHPCDAGEAWEAEIKTIFSSIGNRPLVAVGEVGMDLYWDKSTLERQQSVFVAQIEKAQELDLPLIIHCREALDETLELLSRYGSGVRGVFHSFTGDVEAVDKIREVGDFYFGINGVVTFKNARELRAALPEIGLERMLLETDSPYLAPMPHRGCRNESAYIVDVCSQIASELGITSCDVERATDTNATRLFKI